MLMLHKQNCGVDVITTLRTSSDSHLYWKNHFLKNPLYFRIHADFQAANEIDHSSLGNKTTNIYQQNPVIIGYHIESEWTDILNSSYYEYPLGYDNVDWFVKEVIKLEKKWLFFIKKVRKLSL